MCPINDGSGLAGVSIFDAEPDEVERIVAEDPAILAGVLSFEIHPCRSFPGDGLPAGEVRVAGAIGFASR